jgi:Leucine-rich repeat (LRR) protein
MMTDEAIFNAALEKADPAEQAAYLTEVCGPDTERRRRLEGLLAAHASAADFLERPAVGLHEPDTGDTCTVGPEGGAPADGEAPLTFLQPATRPDSLGRIGHYEVLEVLGKGGFGIVFRAFDEQLQRVVAVKVLAPALAATSPARKRFLREARSSAKVRHENVVQVYAVEEQPLPYLVMEFIPGETLQQRLDRIGPLEVPEVVQLGRQIAVGLAAAHRTGLIHRDIKPGNILIEAGPHPHVKITDFGLARAADDASVSQSGIIAGTPMYMAPEQASADPLDHRADLFSLGSVLYAMCTGRPPFRAPTTLAVLKRVAEDTPRPIREIIPEVPQWLCDLIAKLHAKKPEDRFGSAQEVADLLRQYLAQTQAPAPVKAPPQVAAPAAVQKTPPPQETTDAAPALRRPRWRSRRWAAAAVVLALLGALGFTEATGVTDVRGAVIRLFSPQGTLVVEVDDPEVSVKIDGSELVITGAGAKEIRLKPGRYTVEASKDGKIVSRELVTITKSGKQVVRVSQEPATVQKTAAEKKDPDRCAAEYLLSIGGKVWVNGGPAFHEGPGFLGEPGKEIKTAADLPGEPFRLTGIGLGDNQQVTDAGLAVLRNCKNLTLLELTGTPVTDAGVTHIPNCRELWLQRTPLFTDAALAHLKECKGLGELHLVRLPKVTDAGLAHLKHCQTLTFLNLDSTPVTDAGLVQLKDCKNLTWLGLHNNERITDAGLADLAGLDKLTFLNLDNTKVTAKGVEALAKVLPKCKIEWDGGVIEPKASLDPDRRAAEYVLSIGGMIKVDGDDREIRVTADLPRGAIALTLVNLTMNKQVTDTGLAGFKDCKNLTWVSLYMCGQITDAGMAHFKDSKGLKELYLEGVRLTDAGLAVFKDCKNLTQLQLGNTQVTDDGLAYLKDCKNLMGIQLLNQPVTDAGLAHLKDCKRLTYLDLRATRVTDAGLAYFKDCKDLTRLSLSGTSITNAGSAVFKDCKKLTLVFLDHTSITDAGVSVFKDCKNLTELHLTGTQASDACLVDVKDCKALKLLGVRNTNVSAAGINTLKKALPGCKIDWDGGVIEPK